MFTFLVLLSLAFTSAQNTSETIWSSVVFLMHGERTPLHGPTTPALTPLGAQQMYAQGAMLRERYLSSSSSSLGIDGIERDALDNNQVTALSTDDVYVATGALAFLQGLYPPQTKEYADGNGGEAAARVLLNGNDNDTTTTLVRYPLDGYQYPLVATASVLDPTSPWIAGEASCSAYQLAALDYPDTSTAQTIRNNTLRFYQSLWTRMFHDVFPRSMASYDYAYGLYDYALYQYDHSVDVQLQTAEMDLLRELATTQQMSLHGNLVEEDDADNDMILAVAGRMLASQIVALFDRHIVQEGRTNKINLLFGSHEPILALFSLVGLYDGPSSAVFQDLPGPGAALVFELYSEDSQSTTGNTVDNLSVRFLYRPDANDSTPLVQHGLFTTTSATATNASVQSSMSFASFSAAMRAVGIGSVVGWCRMCDAVSLFCPALEGNGGRGGDSGRSSGGSSNSHKLSPVAAGVIGAVITLAVVLLASFAVMALTGLRVCRVDQKEGQNAQNNGFKGPEKKPSDVDVEVTKNGVQHERVGSWELREGSSHPGKSSVETRKKALSYQSDDDDVDVHARPVVPVEHV